MNTYEVIVIKNKKVIANKICNGTKELRDYIGTPLHYSRNAKAYLIWKDDFNYIAKII